MTMTTPHRRTPNDTSLSLLLRSELSEQQPNEDFGRVRRQPDEVAKEAAGSLAVRALLRGNSQDSVGELPRHLVGDPLGPPAFLRMAYLEPRAAADRSPLRHRSPSQPAAISLVHTCCSS
jgi:hypothetical protein